MTGESYIIKYESMSQFYNYVSIKIDEWYTALSEWDTAYNELVNMECFQGKAAETAKTYLQEIHGPLLYALTSALQAYQTSFLLYKNGFYGIDGHIYSSIPQEILVFLRDVLKTENTQLDTISTSIQTSLNSVSDIFPLSNPTKYVLESTIEGVKNELTAFDSQIDSYEESQYTTLKGDLQALLDSLQTTIDNYLINGTNVVSYVPGTYCGNISVLDLYDKVEVSNAYIANNQEAITSAYEKHLEVYDQMVADYVAQMAEQRKDQGVAKIVGGVVAVTIGIGAIVCTAGAATPVVVSIVGGVAGTCSTAYGLSNMVEGGFDIYYGSIGDITTEAFNPIRDTYFCGNQELYDAWGSLSMTTAGMMWQAGKLPSSISGITTAVAKEAGEDFIYDTTSGLMTNYAAEQWDLNVSESTALNIGLNIGLSLAGGTVSNKFDNFINQATPLPKPDAPNASNIGEWAFAGNEHINVGDVTTNASVSINAGNVVADGMPANVGGVNANLLDDMGKFADDTLENSYQAYVKRKMNKGQTPKDRLEWKVASDYWTKESPVARGNNFNKTVREADIYDYHEIYLDNGKRLDSYDPDAGEIISRKATDLDKITEETYRGYLSEFSQKYSEGTKIRSNAYPELDGQELSGQYILEIPASNANINNIEYYKQIAAEYDVILRFTEEV